MVAGEKVAENWLNTSVCFALSLNASLNLVLESPVKSGFSTPGALTGP